MIDPHVPLDDYAEGRLPPEEMAEVERYLAGCPRCRRQLERRHRLEGEWDALRAIRIIAGRIARGSISVLEPLLKELSSRLERPEEERKRPAFEPLRVLTP